LSFFLYFQSKIDLDLEEMSDLMKQGDYENAYNIFRLGAHADPYAVLRLEDALTKDFQPTNIGMGSSTHLVAYGMNNDNDVVPLRVSASSRKGTSSIYVAYVNETNCHVAGHQTPVKQGCLASKGGLIVEGYGALNYRYNVDTDNLYRSSLYGFSEHEAEAMFHCRYKCPFPEYEKFYKYYGQMDYGAIWMTAALKGRSTSEGGMTFQHGSEDFGQLTEEGRRVAVETGAVTMNVRTHVNRIMTEWAVDGCRRCTETHCPEAVTAWDQAVAQYTGSLVQANLEQPGGYDSGLLFYGLADELCKDFATCGINGDDVEGTAAVNRDLIQQFQSGRIFLQKNNCDMADLVYGKIVHLMTVPLIQGTLRSAYRLQYTHQGDIEEKGRAVAFMASILPDLYSCSLSDADIVYNELNLLADKTPDFDTIKAAFERNYVCLSISCDNVGGLVDDSGVAYANGANPCGYRRTSQRTRDPRGQTSTGAAGGALRQLLIVISAVSVGIALTVYRGRWIPVVSSRVDIFLSQFSSQRTHSQYHAVRVFPPDFSGSHSEFDPDQSESSTDYLEDGFDLSARSHLSMDWSQRSGSI
jgi:hypothetical protein